MNLFVSFEYTSRFRDVFDKGYSNIILDNTAMPRNQEELEQLTIELTELYIKLNRYDAATITILFFNEV